MTIEKWKTRNDEKEWKQSKKLWVLSFQWFEIQAQGIFQHCPVAIISVGSGFLNNKFLGVRFRNVTARRRRRWESMLRSFRRARTRQYASMEHGNRIRNASLGRETWLDPDDKNRLSTLGLMRNYTSCRWVLFLKVLFLFWDEFFSSKVVKLPCKNNLLQNS